MEKSKQLRESLAFLEDIEEMDPQDRGGLSIKMPLRNIEEVKEGG